MSSSVTHIPLAFDWDYSHLSEDAKNNQAKGEN